MDIFKIFIPAGNDNVFEILKKYNFVFLSEFGKSGDYVIVEDIRIIIDIQRRTIEEIEIDEYGSIPYDEQDFNEFRKTIDEAIKALEKIEKLGLNKSVNLNTCCSPFELNPAHPLIDHFVFKPKDIEEANVYNALAILGEKTGIEINELRYISTLTIRMMKSKSKWAE